MKASEFGGDDTRKTQGVQPSPHPLSAREQRRLIHGTDPAENADPDRTAPRPKHGHPDRGR